MARDVRDSMGLDGRDARDLPVGGVPPNWPGPELANGTFEGLNVPPAMAGACDGGVPGRCYAPVRPPSAGQDVADRELGSPGGRKA